jgi:EAL domain-containing protein (putative c-di-GMP-specific phosphodiesterase class I)
MGEMIHIEVTESALMESLLHALESMKDISELGIAFALDDFGTGYSSLSYLQKLPLQYLKIDKSFVDEIMDNKQSANVTKTIVSMAKINNLVTIAEGVENKEQMQFLKDIGCDQIQGYYFSKPLNQKDFLNLLREDKTFS